jgi:hypothetical protein
VVSRRRLILGSAAVVGTAGLGIAGATAWAAVSRTIERALLGGGMRLPDGRVCPVDYVSRAAWGADESLRSGTPQYFPAQTITVHHTGESGDNAVTDAAAKMRALYQYQTQTQNYDDFGYHLMIDRDGVVYEGRWSGIDAWPVFSPGSALAPTVVTGAHVGGYNSGNIGVCLIGNFHEPGVAPTPAARQALVTVLGWLCGVCGIDPEDEFEFVNPVSGSAWPVHGVCGHLDWNGAPDATITTVCPGGNFSPFLDQLRADVAAAIPPPPRDRPAPSSTPGMPGGGDRPQPSVPPTPGGGERPPASDGPPPAP